MGDDMGNRTGANESNKERNINQWSGDQESGTSKDSRMEGEEVRGKVEIRTPSQV